MHNQKLLAHLEEKKGEAKRYFLKLKCASLQRRLSKKLILCVLILNGDQIGTQIEYLLKLNSPKE